MLIILAKDQFIDVLPDEGTRLRIRPQSRPTSLRQALEIVMELESYSIASKKAKQVRKVHLVTKDASNDEKPNSDDLLKQLEACIKAMQRGKDKKRIPNREKKTLPDAKKKKGVCWGCGLPDHILRNCTKETAGNKDAAQPL